MLQGTQKNNLYELDMKSNEIMTDPNPDTSLANHVYENKSNMDLVKYYHQACWSPAKATWITAIKTLFCNLARPHSRISAKILA